MSVDKLDPVWPHILSYLTPRLPKPLSGVTKQEVIWKPDEERARLPDEHDPGATFRSDIRAPELAALMRSSIALNNHAARALYHTVLTDDLPGLVESIDLPAAHPGIASKRELLCLVQNLHLEYRRKGADPSYVAIMADRRRWWAAEQNREGTAISQGIFEVGVVGGALHHLEKDQRKGPGPLPTLSIVTIGAIFGSQDRLWRAISLSPHVISFEGVDYPISHVMALVGRTSAAVFRRCRLSHFCQRGVDGPLAWRLKPNIPAPSPGDPSILTATLTRHIGRHDSYAPSPIGARNRWVIDADLRRVITTREVCSTIYSGLDDYSWEGEQGKMSVEIYASAPRSTLTVDVNVGVPGVGMVKHYSIPLEQERDEMERVKKRARKSQKRKGLAESESLMLWKSSLEAPRCLACNWEFEPGEVAGEGESGALTEEFERIEDGAWNVDNGALGQP